jgi:hypothetical protein
MWPLLAGLSIYTQIQNSSLYVKNAATNKWAWYPTLCTSNYRYICEVPKSVYTCPPAPPPMPPPSPEVDLCEQCICACPALWHMQCCCHREQ